MYKASFRRNVISPEGEVLMASKGWTLLAEKLLNDPLTRNGRTYRRIQARMSEAATEILHADTIFYSTWIQPNTDPSFASDLGGASLLHLVLVTKH